MPIGGGVSTGELFLPAWWRWRRRRRLAGVARNPRAIPAELTAGRLSVPIRRALREELAEWTRLVNDTGDRGPSKNPAALGENSRKSIADWMHPIRVE